MTDVELEKENADIAKAYKKLLKVSYQTLTADDKNISQNIFSNLTPQLASICVQCSKPSLWLGHKN